MTSKHAVFCDKNDAAGEGTVAGEVPQSHGVSLAPRPAQLAPRRNQCAGGEAWLSLPAWQTCLRLQEAVWDLSISCIITYNGGADGQIRVSGCGFTTQSIQQQQAPGAHSPFWPRAAVLPPALQGDNLLASVGLCLKPDQRTDSTFICKSWCGFFFLVDWLPGAP